MNESLIKVSLIHGKLSTQNSQALKNEINGLLSLKEISQEVELILQGEIPQKYHALLRKFGIILDFDEEVSNVRRISSQSALDIAICEKSKNTLFHSAMQIYYRFMGGKGEINEKDIRNINEFRERIIHSLGINKLINHIPLELTIIHNEIAFNNIVHIYQTNYQFLKLLGHNIESFIGDKKTIDKLLTCYQNNPDLITLLKKNPNLKYFFKDEETGNGINNFYSQYKKSTFYLKNNGNFPQILNSKKAKINLISTINANQDVILYISNNHYLFDILNDNNLVSNLVYIEGKSQKILKDFGSHSALKTIASSKNIIDIIVRYEESYGINSSSLKEIEIGKIPRKQFKQNLQYMDKHDFLGFELKHTLTISFNQDYFERVKHIASTFPNWRETNPDVDNNSFLMHFIHSEETYQKFIHAQRNKPENKLKSV